MESELNTSENEEASMPATKRYKQLRDQVIARPEAVERLASLRKETLAEIDLFNMRRALDLSQTDVAEGLGISQAAVSQLEHSEDLKLSTLRRYLSRLGAQLRLVAVFEEDGEERSVQFQAGGE